MKRSRGTCSYRQTLYEQTILSIAALIALLAVVANSILLAIDRRLHCGSAA